MSSEVDLQKKELVVAANNNGAIHSQNASTVNLEIMDGTFDSGGKDRKQSKGKGTRYGTNFHSNNESMLSTDPIQDI